ncbi:hypothetical protein NE619_14615 [Anaerovorax odorimutans]|uniref:Uncharacterized protein n=1 Tax=Anaerovorax odorimutans TaxID=109327 RepID=A0ABT1RS38_9FIRM|nr:hypothetical protein [Anaerovorax odorimutans]MCQ4637966.1 hypothetical protein [Anaerovorax odorimutans]
MKEKEKMPKGKRGAIIFWAGVVILLAAVLINYKFTGRLPV